MQIDSTTLHDLSVLDAPDKSGKLTGVLGLLDRCITYKGRDVLKQLILTPPTTYAALRHLQEGIRFLSHHPQAFTDKVSNGTMVMVDKFFEDTDAGTLPQGNLTLALNGLLQKIFNKQQYFLTQFSITHVADLVSGCAELIEKLDVPTLPDVLRDECEALRHLLEQDLMKELTRLDKKASFATLARLTYRTRRELKRPIQAAILHFARLDAWRSLAIAGMEHGWHFPELVEALPSVLQAQQLYHPLLRQAVSYDVHVKQGQNFLVLTGANMSGKTTYLRAIGILALLAHIGCAVPAQACTISFLQGIITNMHVQDNLMMGDSYFLAEVKRMKATAEKISAQGPQLVLMDELFKGTNVHDAYECTRAVMEGLSYHPHHLMFLSTHLYEVAQHFIQDPSLRFAYFITELGEKGSFRFTYQLKEGISQDRIGYRILQKEGVVAMLKKKA